MNKEQAKKYLKTFFDYAGYFCLVSFIVVAVVSSAIDVIPMCAEKYSDGGTFIKCGEGLMGEISTAYMTLFSISVLSLTIFGFALGALATGYSVFSAAAIVAAFGFVYFVAFRAIVKIIVFIKDSIQKKT